MILFFSLLLLKLIQIWLFVFNKLRRANWLTVQCFPFGLPKYTFQLRLETGRLVCSPFYN